MDLNRFVSESDNLTQVDKAENTKQESKLNKEKKFKLWFRHGLVLFYYTVYWNSNTFVLYMLKE